MLTSLVLIGVSACTAALFGAVLHADTTLRLDGGKGGADSDGVDAHGVMAHGGVGASSGTPVAGIRAG